MKSVLIVEDDNLLGGMYKNKLAESGYIVSLQSSAKEALSVLKNDGIELVLLDIMLGGEMNGFDLLREIKKDVKTAKIKIIVITNLDGQEKTAKEAGADECFRKTNVTPSDIVKRVEQLIGK